MPHHVAYVQLSRLTYNLHFIIFTFLIFCLVISHRTVRKKSASLSVNYPPSGSEGSRRKCKHVSLVRVWVCWNKNFSMKSIPIGLTSIIPKSINSWATISIIFSLIIYLFYLLMMLNIQFDLTNAVMLWNITTIQNTFYLIKYLTDNKLLNGSVFFKC